MMNAPSLPPPPFTPPRPHSLPAVVALARAAWRGDGDLLSLIPAEAYRIAAGPLGYSRRSILIVNDPALTGPILADAGERYPKNDLMVGALEPLVGHSIFVSSGATWRRQRKMIDPAFSHIHLSRAFGFMAAAVTDYQARLTDFAKRGEPLSLDLAMSHLTADIICRTVFSTSLESQMARDVFEAFSVFERSVAHVELTRLIFGKPWAEVPQKPAVLAACTRIRAHLGTLLDTHLAAGAKFEDIAAAVIAARHLETGEGFTREELIDQLGVLFLAGHETTASALTWCFFILATQPGICARMRAEVAAVVGDGAVDFAHIKRLHFIRNVFREALRLYPPITFLPRVALDDAQIGAYRIKKGGMVMIAPWVIHRHHDYWKNPDAFDPDRFSPEREGELVPGTYLPFGQGPRVCVGAAFATTEAVLILASLIRRFEFTALDADKVRPAARLTTRPVNQIFCHVEKR